MAYAAWASAGKQAMTKGSFGALLKRERELREVTAIEVTSATRIQPRYLEALENEDWAQLPGGVFNRGFVRAIARYLGLDEEALIGEYDLAIGQLQSESRVPFEDRIPSTPKWIVAATVFATLLLISGVIAGSIYGWHRYFIYRAARPLDVSSAPAPSPPAASLPTVQLDVKQPGSGGPQALNLAVSTSAPARVRIVADGKVLLDTQLSAGETRHFAAGQGFEVSASNSSAVLLQLNGRQMPPLGAPGTSGTMLLSQKDLRQAAGGNAQP